MNALDRIESPANLRIREALAVRDGAGPRDVWFIEGAKIMETAALAGIPITELFLTESFLGKNRDLIRRCAGPATRLAIVSERVANRLADTQTPQGVFGMVDHRLKGLDALVPGEDEIVAVLDRIQDPGNLGTILRTADAFGIRKVVLIEGTCSPANQKVIRSSAGSVFHLGIAVASPANLAKWARRHGVPLLVTDIRATRTLRELTPLTRAAIVLGNEASGVGAALLRAADERIRIPIPGDAESLNVAVSAAIIFYEVFREAADRPGH